MILALVEEYGTYAADRWVRRDLGVLTMPDAAAISEACRTLTRTMLSVRALRDDESTDGMIVVPSENVPPLVGRLARDEDRAVTWPGYPHGERRLR